MVSARELKVQSETKDVDDTQIAYKYSSDRQFTFRLDSTSWSSAFFNAFPRRARRFPDGVSSLGVTARDEVELAYFRHIATILFGNICLPIPILLFVHFK